MLTRLRGGRGPRLVRCAAVAALVATASLASGQVAYAQIAAPPMTHEPVLLRLHPHVGDTLHTRLEQQTEVSGAQKAGAGSGSRAMTTSVTVSARTIVQASRATTTTVLTIVDSAEVHSSAPNGAEMAKKAEHALRGQQLVLHLAEDGSVESARDARGGTVPRDMAEAMAAMPAVFPHRAVSVGERWEREISLPSAGALGAQGSALVRAKFRLDSLGRNGELAYVSMRGEIVSEGNAEGLRLAGNITGAMRLDRVRGWMTDSRFSVLIRSLFTPPTGSSIAPMQFVTKLTQHLRTMDKR
ncbi:MAG: hypothetical protein ABIP93_04130 [Gemmatimonadaceae bacterium]